MGTIGKSTTQTMEGLGDEWIVSDRDQYPYAWSDEEKARLQDEFGRMPPDFMQSRYAQLLRQEGYFGTEEQLDSYIKSTYDYAQFVDDSDARSKKPWVTPRIDSDDYVLVTPEQFVKRDFDHDKKPFMSSLEDYKKMAFLESSRIRNVLIVPGTMSQAFDIYMAGANKGGYGRYGKGLDIRKKWDEQFGFSDWLDNHSNLKLNTDKVMYRGLRLSDGSIKKLFKQAEKGGEMDFIGPSSWSTSYGVAEDFTKYSLAGKSNQNLTIFENVTKGKHNAMPVLFGGDSEVIYSGKQSFKVLGMHRDEKGVYHVKVEEV